MQVIYLHPHFAADGGAGRMVLETASRLAEFGHRVHVICIRANPTITGSTGERVEFHQIGGPLSSSFWFWIWFGWSSWRVVEAIDRIVAQSPGMPTLLFPQVFPANWWGAIAVKRRPQISAVWYCQEPSAFVHSRVWQKSLPWPKNAIALALSPFLKVLDRWWCRRFRRVLVNSEFSRRGVMQTYGFSREACRTVHLGVDHQRFRPSAAAARKSWVSVIAKISRFKNVDVIVRSVAELVHRGSDEVRLQIVGVGDALEECRQTARELDVEANVIFHGRLSDDRVVEILQQSRVFCLASADEPFGLVVVEALACGTPVVALNSGGPQEILSGLKCGRLCEAPDASEIAKALLHFLSMNESTFAEVSTEATRRAGDYRWESAATEILEELFRAAGLQDMLNPMKGNL